MKSSIRFLLPRRRGSTPRRFRRRAIPCLAAIGLSPCLAFRFLPVLTILLAFHAFPGRPATQVGSAPYKASSTGAGNSYAPVFSADGRHVAFVSHANNLVTNDDLGPHLDLFVRDLVASNTVLVSVSSNAFGGANDNIGLYTMSSNAQVIAFDTVANNLAPGDSNRVSDIYVRDLVSGITRLITPGANGPSFNPLISEDGRRVIFESLASNLVTNDFNGTNDIFIHDLTTGVTELATLNSTGTASPDGPSHSPSISADGLTVAFVSQATNVVVATPFTYFGTNYLPAVDNQLGEVYVRDVANQSNIWAVASHVYYTRVTFPAPLYSRFQASRPCLSREGRYVVFRTEVAVIRYDLHESPNNLFGYFPPPSSQFDSNLFSFQNNPRVIANRIPFAEFEGVFSSVADVPLLLAPDGRYAVFSSSTNSSNPTAVRLVDFDRLITNAVSCCEGARPQIITSVLPSLTVLSTNLIVPHLGEQPHQTQLASAISISGNGQRVFFKAEMPPSSADGIMTRIAGLFLRDMTNNFSILVTTNMELLPGADLRDTAAAISPDDSMVAWDSPDAALVADDLNRGWDVFVRNVDTGSVQCISLGDESLVAETGVASARSAAVSADGKHVIFVAGDGNWVPLDRNLVEDAFIHDKSKTTNIALGAAESNLSNSPSNRYGWPGAIGQISLSADGKFACFVRIPLGGVSVNAYRVSLPSGDTEMLNHRLTNDFNRYDVSSATISSDGRLVAFATGVNTAIYLRDFRIDGFEKEMLLSSNIRQDGTGNGPSLNPIFSPDSRWIVFQSLATDLTYDSDAVDGYQLYAREIDTGFIKRISYSGSDGTNVFALSGGATNAVFSADARFAFFEGTTGNLVYRHDLLNDMDDAGTERRANLLVCAGCANPAASGEGRLIAYESRPEQGGGTNVFVKDIESGSEELISVSMTGTNGNGASFSALLSHDARFVVFASKASDLVPGDNNRATDIFVRDRWAGMTHCLSRNLTGTGTGNHGSSNPILSADGRTVAFQSFASDLVTGDYNDTRDVFVVTLGGADTDGDGMEDDWEVAYFNTLDRDGSGDFDHDGLSDRDEFRAGTNPANDASILRVLRLTTGVAGGPEPARTTVILWSATPGKTYRVETKATLDEPWQAVGGDMVASTVEASATHTVPGGEPAGSGAHRFYRVVLVP